MSDIDFDDLSREERAALIRAREALIAAGPTAEVPARLATPGGARTRFPRRRALALAFAAALAGAAAFAGGYVAGDDDFEAVRTVAMSGAGATGVIELGPRDEAGNWEMVLEVRGLPVLTDPKGYYELALTIDGRPVAPCGTFKVRPGETRVRFTASYQLGRFDGWVVLAHPRGHDATPAVVLRT